MRTSRAVAASAASEAAPLSAGVITGGGNASAASYNGVYGAGHSVIDHHDLIGGTTFPIHENGWNCVVTVRDTPGQAIPMLADVGPPG